jgi:hypothetical protein
MYFLIRYGGTGFEILDIFDFELRWAARNWLT